MRTIWIARHGNREDFVDRTWKETAKWPHDPGLSPDGIIQAKELGLRLKDENITAIFSSPFLRTIQTAKETADLTDLKINVEYGLSEWLKSEWFFPSPVIIPLEDKTDMFPQINSSYRSITSPVYPETFSDMSQRVKNTVMAIIRSFPGNLLLIGHGASVDASARALVGDGLKINSSLCSIIKISGTEYNWELELNGDTSHLSDPEVSIRWT